MANQFAQQLGKLGGLKTLSIKGKDYYKDLGRKGGLAKRKNWEILSGQEVRAIGDWSGICPNHKVKIYDCWKKHPDKE